MLVEEMFKEFTSSVLRETKRKADYDVCIDVYAKTQLLDISAIYNNPEFATDSTTNYANIQYENHKAIAESKWKDFDIVLPFDSNFIKLYDNNAKGYDLASYVFIREYAPTIYTGVFIVELTTVAIYKILFTIRENYLTGEKEVTVTLNDVKNSEDGINKLVEFTMSKLRYALHVLGKLSNKNQSIYKVQPIKAEYLRKKVDKSTIKVSRPIYIYLNKSDDKTVYAKYPKRDIERLNSWLVRGHWRRLDDPKKRGKNANGEYTVEGFTWVVPHICGNPDTPITNRTYIAINK